MSKKDDSNQHVAGKVVIGAALAAAAVGLLGYAATHAGKPK